MINLLNTHILGCGDSTSASLSEEQKKLKKQMEALQLKLFRSRSDNEKLKSQIDIAHKVKKKKQFFETIHLNKIYQIIDVLN